MLLMLTQAFENMHAAHAAQANSINMHAALLTQVCLLL